MLPHIRQETGHLSARFRHRIEDNTVVSVGRVNVQRGKTGV